MAFSFTATMQARFGWEWKDSTGNPVDSGNVEYDKGLADGYSENQGEVVWYDKSASLLNGQSRTLDLTALTRELFEGTLTTTFYRVRGLLVIVESTTRGELVVGNAGSNEWSGPFEADGSILVVDPDSEICLTSRQYGWKVDDVNKNLKLFARNGDVTYSIGIVGTQTDDGTGSGSAY